MFSSNRFHEKPHKQDTSADAHTGFLGNHLTLKLFKKDFHLDLFLKNLRNFHLLLKIKIKIQFSRIKVLLLYASEQIKSKKKTFLYTVLQEIQLFGNFTLCISVDVAFLVRLFSFVLKTRRILYLFH